MYLGTPWGLGIIGCSFSAAGRFISFLKSSIDAGFPEIVLVHQSTETFSLDVPRIRDDDLEDRVPGHLHKQDLELGEMNGPIMPVNLTFPEDHGDTDSGSTDDRNLSFGLGATSHAMEEGGR